MTGSSAIARSPLPEMGEYKAVLPICRAEGLADAARIEAAVCGTAVELLRRRGHHDVIAVPVNDARLGQRGSLVVSFRLAPIAPGLVGMAGLVARSDIPPSRLFPPAPRAIRAGAFENTSDAGSDKAVRDAVGAMLAELGF